VVEGQYEDAFSTSTSDNFASQANLPDLDDGLSRGCRGCRGSEGCFPTNEQMTPLIGGKTWNHPLHPLLSPSVNFSQSTSEGTSQVVEGERAPSTDPLPQAGAEDEGMRMIKAVQMQARGVTKMFWHVPHSGYPDGYVPRNEFFQRLRDCLTCDDPHRRAAVIAAMKERLA
jgi:hypothetical protein